MRALQYQEFGGSVEVVEVADPVPPPDGVVVEVAASGLCRSDWHGWMGHDPAVTTFPHVPGHELAGAVVAVGADVVDWSVGARVTVPFIVACARCRACRAGNEPVCLQQWQPGFHGWGSHAEYVAIPRADHNLVAVPEGLELAVAAGLGCRFTTAWRAVVDVAAVQPGEWVAVHGCGGLGLSVILAAQSRGARVIAVDVDEHRLAQAKDLGAEVVLGPDDVVDRVREATDGGTDVSVDAVGNEEAVANALHGLSAGGRHVQVGLLPAGTHVPMEDVIARELSLVGAHGAPARDVAAVLEAVADGTVVPQRLAGRRLDLAGGARAMVGAAGTRSAGLAVIEPHATVPDGD